MNDVRDRLTQCFAAVFPDLSPSEIPRASMTSVANWESLSTVTLISVIEEEFGIEVPAEDLEVFVSFELIADWLEEKTASVS